MRTERQLTIWTRTRWQILRQLVSAILFIIGVWVFSPLWCSRQADAWFAGDRKLQNELANGVAQWVEKGLGRDDFNTGSSQFNGEWLFGTYMMAGMGFGQTAREHPELKAENMRRMGVCIERLLSPEVRAFDKEMWYGSDPIDTLDQDLDHGAYLGYLNLVLGLHRLLDPDSPYAELNDRITASLIHRIEHDRFGLLESYPQESYPVDNCAAIGSIGLHGKAAGVDHGEFLTTWARFCREKMTDRDTGLLFQSMDPDTGLPLDYPRGSGTCLGLYFLSFADLPLSRDLYRAVRKQLAGSFLGFGGIKEYPPSVHGQRGDIDSGPVVFGFGLSPTGFGIAGTRIHGDSELFSRLFGTAYAMGAPLRKDGRLNFVTGASLGDAILFAMLTAGPHTQKGETP